MQAGRASSTAEHNALLRTLEHVQPPHKRLFEDRFAEQFLTWPLSLVGRLARVPGLREFIIGFIDRRWSGARSSVVARTRFIDELIREELDRGFDQFVVLGAGYDSRAYRLPEMQGVRVFEVDHPDTQAAKRRALKNVPAHLRFVPTDFKQGELESNMLGAGFDESAKTLILWEGVTNYLDAASVDATLKWCARAAPGGTLIFTYVDEAAIQRPESFTASSHVFEFLERVGERFTFGINPAQLEQFLADRGFQLEIDLAASEYRARYYGEAGRQMRGHEFYHTALARIA